MRLHIRANPRHQLLDDASTTGAIETKPPAAPAGPGSLLVPEQRTATSPQTGGAPAARERAPEVPEQRPRRHLRHRWEITGGDDGQHLISTCQVCGRTKSMAAPARNHGVVDYAAELRRLR